MKVFKFGGASIKNASAVKNVVNIIKSYNDQLVVVVSAMDKTTNSSLSTFLKIITVVSSITIDPTDSTCPFSINCCAILVLSTYT